jgi:hypothetical protein
MDIDIMAGLDLVDFEMTLTDVDGTVLERRLYDADGNLIEESAGDDNG